ncbi:MATE family efflux transporter [Xylanibacter rodentium]|uniref:MATE family efflux transporter n=1 Tax=Xylanibacter rodentium TaxID=2736289 RepID=UPI0025757194|nr:MATE family efflux transporter [Xylanibacter rodentium]
MLDALNISDYGLYSVIGGLIAMLGFVLNSLVITTQRYISYYKGKGDENYIKEIFANSLLLHIIIGIVLCGALLLIKEWLISNVLNIDPVRTETAKDIYVITTLTLFITILTAPYKSLFIARENIVYISVVEVIDGILKFGLAIWLTYISADKLFVYAIMMLGILVVNFLSFTIYALVYFKESCIIIRPKSINRKCLSHIAGFASWTTYGMGAVSARNQGFAVVLNHFFGTVINASYGIAFQIYGAMAFTVTSILNAMTPQIIKAEGENNRERMFFLAEKESKFSVLLMAIISIPIMIEMPKILMLWLKDVPEDAVMFCRFILVSFLCDQLTMGLNVVNQALGNIRRYTILMYTPKLLSLPMAWAILYYGGQAQDIMVLYLIIELLVSMMRIPYIKRAAGLNAGQYVRNVILRLLPTLFVISATGYICTTAITAPYRFVLTFVLSVSTGFISAWFFTLEKAEQDFVKNTFKRLHVCLI